jgi:hypothetical protein
VDSSALCFGGLDSVVVFEVLLFLLVFVSPFGWRLVGRWVLCSFGLLTLVLVFWADFGKLSFWNIPFGIAACASARSSQRRCSSTSVAIVFVIFGTFSFSFSSLCLLSKPLGKKIFSILLSLYV